MKTEKSSVPHFTTFCMGNKDEEKEDKSDNDGADENLWCNVLSIKL